MQPKPNMAILWAYHWGPQALLPLAAPLRECVIFNFVRLNHFSDGPAV